MEALQVKKIHYFENKQQAHFDHCRYRERAYIKVYITRVRLDNEK